MKCFAQIIIALFQLLLQQSAFAAEPKHTTLIVLLDGLRADALSAQVTPNLARLARDGIRSEMTPIWPAISRPNHWGIVTGLNARHSGIFHNDMYNPAAGRPFNLQDPNFFHGEPIRHGKFSPDSLGKKRISIFKTVPGKVSTSSRQWPQSGR